MGAGDAWRYAAAIFWIKAMKEFLSNLGSSYWWISVVIVGILINVSSFYLTRKLDKRLSNISSWWRKKSEEKNARRLKEIEELRDNSDEQIFLAFKITQLQMKAIMYFIFAVLGIATRAAVGTLTHADLFLRILKVSLWLVSALCLVGGLTLFLNAWDKENLLQSSRAAKQNDLE